jgi:hypothetical protein
VQSPRWRKIYFSQTSETGGKEEKKLNNFKKFRKTSFENVCCSNCKLSFPLSWKFMEKIYSNGMLEPIYANFPSKFLLREDSL